MTLPLFENISLPQAATPAPTPAAPILADPFDPFSTGGGAQETGDDDFGDFNGGGSAAPTALPTS